MKAVNQYIIIDPIKEELKKVGGLILTDEVNKDNRYLKAKVISVGNLVEGTGIDVVTGKSVNMIESGIIDPVLVTKTALKNAVSVVTTIISADCVISNIRIDEGS